MKRFVLAFCFATCGALAYALGTFGTTFNTTYKITDGSALSVAKCSICHASIKGGRLNPYGVDIQKVMKSLNTKKMTAEALRKVEGLDSLKTGATNIVRIRAGKNPGLN